MVFQRHSFPCTRKVFANEFHLKFPTKRPYIYNQQERVSDL